MRSIINYCLSRGQSYNSRHSYSILLFRCFSGLMMLPYGYGKIINYDRYVADFFGNPLGIGDVPSLWLTIFAQVVCPVALILGFQTRISAGILAFNMLIAVKYHFFDPFSIKALPMLFLGLYIIQVLWDAGKYSLDFRFYSSESTPSFSPFEKRSICCTTGAFAVLCLIFSNIVSGPAHTVLLILATMLFVLSYYFLKNE